MDSKEDQDAPRLQRLSRNISTILSCPVASDSVIKLQQLLAITDAQLCEFRSFKRNETKLIQILGDFVDLKMLDDLTKAGNFKPPCKTKSPHTSVKVSKLTSFVIVAGWTTRSSSLQAGSFLKGGELTKSSVPQKE